MLAEYWEVSLQALSVGGTESEFLVESPVRNEAPRHVCHKGVMLMLMMVAGLTDTIVIMMMATVTRAFGSPEQWAVGAG